MSLRYILDGRTPVPCEDEQRFAEWEATSLPGRQVARTQVTEGVEVSTVFFWLDLSIRPGEVQCFETLVFGGPLDHWTARYSTWEEANRGHGAMVERVRQAIEGEEQGSGDA